MKHISWLIIFICTFFPLLIFAQAHPDLNKDIPLDTSITFGKLDNGLTYYIKANHKPEKRAVLRLVVNAGSVLEDSDQCGLAHFVEHMGFNGTKNFKKHELIDYLESIGMKFGPEVNAYTSFDETVYMIDVPTDSAEMVVKGIQILQEWAHNVSFEDNEIDKERGVIEEEWRLRRGARMRMLDKQLPVIFKNSQYAKRLTIGDINTIRNFKHDVLRRFYNDWYRPDLMAVVAVGDFDKNWIEKLVKEQFNKITDPQNERLRINFPVPDNNQTEYAIATDPEATNTSVGIYYKMDVKPERTLSDYREHIIENLFNGMLNDRFSELTQKPDAPFIYGYASKSSFVKTKDIFALSAMVKEDGIERGFKTLLEEAERVNRFGFTQTEFERQKESMLREIEQNYNERDKTESRRFASEYIRNFLNDEPAPGIEYEYNAYKELLPGITLDEVNKLAGEWTGIKDRVIVVSATQKDNLPVPGNKDFDKIIDDVKQEKLEPYKDVVSNLPLVDSTPSGSEIISETRISEIDAMEWKLGNGATVIVKPTDYKNDEILFDAFSNGGSSLESDEDYPKTILASGIMQLSGVGKFDYITLNKMLADKIVRVQPYIGEPLEGMNGNSAPQDFETFLQLVYLYFTSPRVDSSAFLSYKERMGSYLKNRSLSPEAAFMDTITTILSQYNPRRTPISEEILSQADLGKSYNFFKERFSDASDFCFVFVGNIDTVKMKPLIEEYIGGIPSLNKKEEWRDLKIFPPSGVISKKVIKGIEPKSMVSLTFSGTADWSYQNEYDMESMRKVLEIKLREVIREDKSGTYGVGVSAFLDKYPEERYNITIRFGCKPERVDELVNTVFQVIDSLKNYPVGDIYITKVKEILLRDKEVKEKQNNYWVGVIQQYLFNDFDWKQLSEEENRIHNFNKEAVITTAQKYFDMSNYVKVVLYPQKD